MGFLFQNVCYPSDTLAKQAACSGAGGVWGQNTTVLTTECTNTTFTATTMTMCRRSNGGTCTTFTQPYPAFSSCTFDGGPAYAMDWLYVAMAVLVIVWGGKRLINLFDSPHAES